MPEGKVSEEVWTTLLIEYKETRAAYALAVYAVRGHEK